MVGGATLKAEQRDWVKGRNDCWKADDLRSWVEQEYKHRISEFQARFRRVPSRGPYFLACDDHPANEVAITCFESLLPSGIIERADHTGVLYASPSGSGAKYEGRNVLFREHQGEAAVERDGEQLPCGLVNK